MLKKLFLLCAVLFTAATAMAQVETITINFTPGAGGEASIKYMGINGNEELNKLVPIFIKASGWLKQVSSSADFDLRGVANSTTCEYIVSVGGAGETRGRVTFSNPREGAKKVVDAVLAVIFPKENVKELCQSKIAFCVDTGANRRNIYTCDIAGGDVQKLTDFSSLCVEPTWSPDATSIGYTKYTNSSTSILETRLNPLSTRVLTSFPGLNVGVSFSPDFKRIVWKLTAGEDKARLSVLLLGASLLFGACQGLEALREMVRNETMAQALEELESVCALVGDASSHLRLDFSVVNDMSYYNGLIFRGYLPGLPSGILAGGRYDNLLKKMGKSAGAIGFAVYLDLLEHMDSREESYDADVLLLYGPDTAPNKVARAAEENRRAGFSVRTERQVPPGLKFRWVREVG